MAQTTAWNAEAYSKNARFVSDLGAPLLDLLDPKPGEMILDLGCGDGALTEKIKSAGSSVIGADASRPLLEAAHARGLNVVQADGERLAFGRHFGAVFSNAALHWMKHADRVVEGVARCLKPGGRFVGEFGGKGNVQTIRAALHSALRKRGIDPWSADPWYYPSPEEYSELLTQFGFAVEYIELIPRPTKLPGDILAWLEVFAQPFINSVPSAENNTLLNEVRHGVEPLLRQADGSWYADYVRLRFKAIRCSSPQSF
jgi:trans-aconitate methyltransferase